MRDPIAALKKSILFVGSFRNVNSDGTTGGQTFACRALLDSSLSDRVHWILLDSTMEALPPPRLGRRLLLAVARIREGWRILRKEIPAGALLFTSFRIPSLCEKLVLVALLRKKGVHVVVSIRSQVDEASMGLVLRVLRSWLLSSAQVVVCQSEAAKQQLLRKGTARTARVVVIPNWIDVASYTPVTNMAHIPATKGWPTFLYLGWLEPYKGIMDLLEAFEEVLVRFPTASLHVCGEGSASNLVRERVRERFKEQQVSLRGWIQGADKTHALHECDALVLPSHTEGMPNAVLEAMACSRPVVATRVGGLPELVEDGQTGILVEPGNIGALAAAMARIAERPDEAREMGVTGRARVLARHDVQRTWHTIAEVLGVF